MDSLPHGWSGPVKSGDFDIYDFVAPPEWQVGSYVNFVAYKDEVPFIVISKRWGRELMNYYLSDEEQKLSVAEVLALAYDIAKADHPDIYQIPIRAERADRYASLTKDFISSEVRPEPVLTISIFESKGVYFAFNGREWATSEQPARAAGLVTTSWKNRLLEEKNKDRLDIVTCSTLGIQFEMRREYAEVVRMRAAGAKPKEIREALGLTANQVSYRLEAGRRKISYNIRSKFPKATEDKEHNDGQRNRIVDDACRALQILS